MDSFGKSRGFSAVQSAAQQNGLGLQLLAPTIDETLDRLHANGIGQRFSEHR